MQVLSKKKSYEWRIGIKSTSRKSGYEAFSYDIGAYAVRIHSGMLIHLIHHKSY